MLGLYDDVWVLISNVGWRQMMSMQWDTYKTLVCEFLSTLVVNRKKKLFTFHMGNIFRTLSVEVLNNILNVPEGGFLSQTPGFSKAVIWKDHTDEEYISNVSKASEIRNTVFLYLNRVLAFRLCCRGHNMGVTMKELFILHYIMTSTNFDNIFLIIML